MLSLQLKTAASLSTLSKSCTLDCFFLPTSSGSNVFKVVAPTVSGNVYLDICCMHVCMCSLTNNADDNSGGVHLALLICNTDNPNVMSF